MYLYLNFKNVSQNTYFKWFYIAFLKLMGYASISHMRLRSESNRLFLSLASKGMNVEEMVKYIEKFRMRCIKVLFDKDGLNSKSGIFSQLPACEGQDWPLGSMGPLSCGLHIKVNELPFIPKRIAHCEYVTMFLNLEYIEYGSQSQEGGEFLIRCIQPKIPIKTIMHPEYTTQPRKTCRFEIADDYPDIEDIVSYLNNDGIECERSLICDASERRKTIGGIKINGYPSTIQGPSEGGYDEKEFGIIIDSNEQINLRFGDSIVFNAGWSDLLQNWYSSWDTF